MKDSIYYYGLGIESLEKGDIQTALVHFITSTAITPHFKTYEQLYHLLSKLNCIEESGIMLENAYMLNPNSDKVAFLYAKWLVGLENYDEARKILHNITSRNDTYKMARKLLDSLDEQD